MNNQEDLYCLECGYNLRGLEGDPRRCPECSACSTLADLRVPAESILAQGKKLETLPSVCVAWVIALLCFGLPLLIFSRFVGAVATSLAFLGWVLTARAFASSCEGRSGWGLILLEIHGCALLFLTFVIMLGSAVVGLVTGPSRGLVFAVAAALLWTAGIVAYRDARRRLTVVKRRAAVELAKRELEARRTRSARLRSLGASPH